MKEHPQSYPYTDADLFIRRMLENERKKHMPIEENNPLTLAEMHLDEYVHVMPVDKVVMERLEPGDQIAVKVKNVWSSRTHWLGIITLCLGIIIEALNYMSTNPIPELKAAAPILLLISGILTIVLRRVTTSPVA